MLQTNNSEACRWFGASGQSYDYEVYALETDFKSRPGNYIFTRRSAEGWVNIYTGETGDLSERFNSHHKLDCAKRQGATHIHAHLSSDSAETRRREESDIIRRYSPPCNG